MMSNNANSTLLSFAAIGCSVLALSGSLYYITQSKSKKSQHEKALIVKEVIDVEDDKVEYITEDDIVKVFDTLFIEMQNVLANLGQQIQQIQMMGQHIPQEQLRQLMKSQFETALLAKQGQVYEDNDMDEDCVQEATMEFLADPEKYPKAKKAVQRFQMLWENVSGEKVANLSAAASTDDSSPAKVKTLSKEQMLTALELYFDTITNSMLEIVQNVKEKGENLSDPTVMNRIQMEFASAGNDKGEEQLLAKMGISLDVFKESIEKHSQDPDVTRTLAMLQLKQQQSISMLGFGSGS